MIDKKIFWIPITLLLIAVLPLPYFYYMILRLIIPIFSIIIVINLLKAEEQKNLIYVFVLIDIRIRPQNIDLLFMNWLGENKVPFIRIFSKCDKVNSIDTKKKVLEHRKSLLEYWEEVPEYIISSSKSKIGKNLILDKIEKSKLLIS